MVFAKWTEKGLASLKQGQEQRAQQMAAAKKVRIRAVASG
jgi:hypothetical protein